MKNKQETNFTKFYLNYKLEEVIGEGTFGKVYKGIKDSKYYGIKKINKNEEGLHITTIREIRALRKLNHKNIIELLEINLEDSNLFLIFPYYKFDLYKYLKRNIPNRKEVIHIFKQIVDGLEFLKKENILHRDIKTSNILLDFNLNVKLADFGMSTTKSSSYSPGVVTLWYRPPEILLNMTYDFSCDIWGLGCILGEMMIGKPLFPGSTEITVLENIIFLCGSINEKSLPGIKKVDFSLPQSIRNLKKNLKSCEDDLVNLLDEILIINPSNRPKIEEISKNNIFINYDSEYFNNIAKRFYN